jgi:hypothetical protein
MVEDYPYGFRLRCNKRFWLEHNPRKGTRLVAQTTNPKRNDTWNKPKYSTYCSQGGCMGLNAEGHVTWSGLTQYDDVDVCVKWRGTYGATMPDFMQEALKLWIAAKLLFEKAKAEGQVKLTMTSSKYGCITDPGFGKPIEEPVVKTEVLTSDYTANERLSMGRTLTAD